jgi:hypothetical protein
MRTVGWPQAPNLLPDDTTQLTVVAPSRPRSMLLLDSNGTELVKPRLTQRDADIALLTTPRNNDWGTMLALIKAPSLSAGPVPVAQRAGATLWFAPSGHDAQPAPGHAVEWVTPGDWYLVASHLSTERHWFDIIGWGTGWGSTVEFDLTPALVDTGLTFIGVAEPIVLARLCFHNRTFTHDEIVAQADQRTLPGDPIITWDLNDPALSIVGTRTPALSWDAATPRSKRRAVQVVPARTTVWETECKVPAKPTAAQLNKAGDGFMVCGSAPRIVHHEPTISLMNTPYPNEDDASA